jgi:serine/threonine-protein kinase
MNQDYVCLSKGPVAHIQIYKHVRSGHEIVEKTQTIKRGLDEINIMKNIKGNCFPKLIDYTTKPNQSILYMEKIEGITFSEIASRKKFREKVLNNLDIVFFKCIECLNKFHSEGFLHRDVKPDNLMIDEQLSVYLIDFGTAIPFNAQHLKSGYVGTLAYMSPEAVFRPHEMDASSDYFSLGKTLIELVGKETAYVSHETLEAILSLCQIQKSKRKIYLK